MKSSSIISNGAWERSLIGQHTSDQSASNSKSNLNARHNLSASDDNAGENNASDRLLQYLSTESAWNSNHGEGDVYQTGSRAMKRELGDCWG